MWPTNPLTDLWLGEIFDSLLPDFVLGFAFFTALSFAVLGRRLAHRRSAAAMSAALGMALAVGLVFWEYRTGWSIRSLGPVAAGLALIALALVIYQAFKQIGGTWVGGSLAFGAALLIGSVLELPWPVNAAVVQTLTVTALLLAAMGYLLHRHKPGASPPPTALHPPSEGVAHASPSLGLRREAERLDQLERQSRAMERQLEGLQAPPPAGSTRDDRDARTMTAGALQRLLPRAGWLTDQLGDLRAKVHRASQGELARINALQSAWRDLGPADRKAASQRVRAGMKRLRIEQRLERLDRAVAEAEKRITDLLRRANRAMDDYDYERMTTLLAEARRLQHQVSELITAIERTEKRLDKELTRLVNQPAGKPEPDEVTAR